MNALVSVNNDTAGIRGLTKAQRAEVAQQLKSMASTPENNFARELEAMKQKIGMVSTSESSAKTKSTAASNTGTTDETAVKTKSASSTDHSKSSSSKSNTSTRDVSSNLDKDSFLELMVLQLQNQDPTDPMDNSQMLAQLAQFSALEQMTNLNDSFEDLSTRIDQLNFLSAGSLVGSTVTGKTSDGTTVTGTVDRVSFEDDSLTLVVNGTSLTMDQIETIS